MPRATAARQSHAIATKKPARDLQRLETAATFARWDFNRGSDRFRFQGHPFAKFSARATALRMDMDLLTVS
jgi:hypothetical protein